MSFALLLPAGASEFQKLKSGHVPAALARLNPIGNLPASRRLNLAISLPLRNEQELDALLQELHDPASPNYRRYLTTEEFTQRFGPTEQDYQALMDFAKSNGLAVTVTHPNRVVLDVEGTVTDIQKAFHLNLHVYRHPLEAREFYAPDGEPSVDFDLPILHVSGFDNYALPHPNVREQPAGLAVDLLSPKVGSGPSGSYQGRDFRTAYVPGTPLNGAGQSVGLVEYDGFYGNDITNYESQTRLPNVPLTVVPIGGGISTPGNNSVEVSLDIEMVISMAPGVSRVYVYEAPNTGTHWVDMLSRMANDNLSKQLSCSWGGGSPDPASEQVFKQMDAQGQSFFSATGDSDAFTGAIDFPAESPNITQVGGTTLTTGTRATYQSETVWNWGLRSGSYAGSSGGISTHYTIPSYQRGVSMSANQGSTTMRNVPDVALTADNVYVVYGNGQTTIAGGTSCAAPLWAGLTALINQQAAATGQAPVGFLNPALYNIGRGFGYAAAFHDIASGNNFSGTSPTRFAAVAGYDLCTGWGTPNGTNLINALAGPVNLTPFIVSNSFLLVAESCANGAVDPAETVSVSFGLANAGSADTTNLVATLLSTNGILFPSGPQTYGVLSTNGTTVSLPFTFTAMGICGSTNTASLRLQDGTANLGTVSFSFTMGQPIVTTVFSENFDGVTAPALPAGWTTSAIGAESNWVTLASLSDSVPNSAFSPNSSSNGVNELNSPPITLPTGPAQLAFRQNFNLETSYDGGVLEISIAGGAWTDILAAGGSFVTGGYNYTISTVYNNPLFGRQAWSGISGGFITTEVKLPASASGQTIQLRWRCGSDDNVGAPGWYVDTISITSSGYACCTQSTDLGVTLTASPDPVAVGQTLSYALVVTNLGPASASVVTVTDTLPASVTFVSASPGCVSLGGRVVCNLGTFPSGGTTNFTVVVTPTAEGLITNTLTVASLTTDPNPANNTAISVISVTAPPVIMVQPSSQAVLPGANVTFQVTATGPAPLTYQWSHNGTNLPGAVDTVLTLTNVGISQAGSYAVLVSGTSGSTLSSDAMLTVLDPSIVGQPLGQSLMAGATARFTVDGSGSTPFSYQWLKDGVPLVDGGKLSGTTTASLVVSNVQAGEMAAYSVVISNSYGSVVSSNALLTVWPLLGWGRDDYGQADIPGGLTNVTGIAAGFSHSLALRGDGTVIAWGAGASNTGVLPHYGQSFVPDGLTNVTGIAAGFDHNLALRADGTVAAWGAGTTNTGADPNYGQALVPEGLSNVVAVAAGAYHSLALMSDGTVVAWGDNDFGQTNVPGGLTNVAAVAAGGNHSLALKSDGTMVAWGDDSAGQTDIPGGLTNVAAVAGGYGHSLALRADGIVIAWGDDSAGQTNVPPGLTNAVAVAGGFAHSLALRGDGTLVAWGDSSYGQTNVPAGLTNAVAVTAGSYHNLALESDGRPALTVQPVSQVATAGATVQLLAMAAGLQPLSYQWQWNGTDIANATNATITLTNVQSAQAGGYVVVVSNVAGSVTSVVAGLTVSSPQEILLQISLAGPQVSISFASQPGVSYALEYKQLLDDPAWTSLPWSVIGTGGLITLQDTNTSADSRYYRVRRE